jgi:hypothetical protein
MNIFHRKKFQVHRYNGHHIKNIPLGRLILKTTPEDIKDPVEWESLLIFTNFMQNYNTRFRISTLTISFMQMPNYVPLKAWLIIKLLEIL